MEIGKRLVEAKDLLKHGEWGKWLEEKVEFTQQTANKFMRCANEFSNMPSTAQLGTGKLFALLSVPQEDREDFISQPHEVNGQIKTLEEMSTRELSQVIKEKKN